jgi:hypothetical protein
MTKAEYAELYRKARQETAQLSLKAQIEIKLAYSRAAAEVNVKLLDAQERGLSIITINANSQLLNEIQMASTTLTNDIEKITMKVVEDSAEIATKADREYLLSVIADIDSSLNANTINQVYLRLNTKAVENMVSRVYSDGYTLSSRVWNLKGEFEDTIKNIIASGIAQGRDPVKIIKDIQIYVADGKLALSGRWGNLESGTAEWSDRIHQKIDWRAQRLVRSELQATLQSISIQAGEANPGTTGNYTWVLGPGMAHCAECMGYASQIFTKDTIPEYPHPNCGCQIRPVLRDLKDFVNDLKDWGNGTVTDQNRYIDDWAQNYANAA